MINIKHYFNYITHKTEKGRRIFCLKRSEYNKKDEVNTLNILSNKNTLLHLRNFEKELQVLD